MNLNAIAEQVKRDEGCRLTPYLDSVGVMTIGYGTNISSISEEEALMLLHSRLMDAVSDLQSALPWTESLDDARAGALVNMAYNVGLARLLGFKNMLAALQAGDWQRAHNEALSSVWAHQVGPRALRIAQTFLTGKE